MLKWLANKYPAHFGTLFEYNWNISFFQSAGISPESNDFV